MFGVVARMDVHKVQTQKHDPGLKIWIVILAT